MSGFNDDPDLDRRVPLRDVKAILDVYERKQRAAEAKRDASAATLGTVTKERDTAYLRGYRAGWNARNKLALAEALPSEEVKP